MLNSLVEIKLSYFIREGRHDPMDLLAGVLYVLIGALAGGLLALVIDTYYLGQRLQRAIAAKRQMQAVLRRAERKLANADTRGRKLAHDLAMAAVQPVNSGERQELEKARAEIKTLRDNLNRVSNHIDELHDERQALRQDLAAAKARVEAQRDYFGRLDEELRELRQRYDESCGELTAAAAAKKLLEDELNLVRKKAETASQLEIELHQTRFQLKTAEARLNQLKARQRAAAVATDTTVTTATTRPVETVEPDAEAPEEESAVATRSAAEVAADSLEESERQDTPTPGASPGSDGQGDLEQVRGIGPVYARRLREAGISDLTDLANQRPEEVSEVVGLKAGQHDRVLDWINQAQALSSS